MKVRRGLIIRVVFFLLAGAIINVAVAWGCALFIAPSWDWRDATALMHPNGQLLGVSQSTTFGSSSVICSVQRSGASGLRVNSEIVPEWARSAITETQITGANWWFRGTGFPCSALWCVHSFALMFEQNECRVEGAMVVPMEMWKAGSLSMPRSVPLRPIFPGFAINTIFYAAVLWMLFAIPGAVRRRVRIKRGQCAACGYSLRENVSEKCPECGADV